MKVFVIFASLALIVAGIGCVSLSTALTPAEIDKQAVDYAVSAGVADANEFKGYGNLAKAEKLQYRVDSAHQTIQLSLAQRMEKDKLTYATLKAVVTNNVVEGRERENLLFGEKGLLSLGLSMAGFGTLTGFLGLMRKRPGDITSDEMEKLLAEATGTTQEQLTEKQKQLVQLVQGIQKFMDTYGKTNAEALTVLKDIFDKTQDTSTQVAVAEIKKTNNV